MRGDLIRAAKALVLPTIGLIVVVAFFPGRIGLAVRVYALVLCAAALVLMVAALRRAYPSARPLRRSRKRQGKDRRGLPGALARLEQEAHLGVAGSFDLHHRLRPHLRTLASELLSTRCGVSLDREPESARQLLGDETWDLVRKDRPPPEDRLARGLTITELRHVVESLEAL